MHGLRSFVLAFALSVFAALSIAQPTPLAAAGSVQPSGPDGSPDSSHGWAVIRADNLVPWALIHIPPRMASNPAQSGGPAQDGSARIAAALGSEPLAIAAVGNRVYMAFAVDTPGGNDMRRVLSVAAIRSPVSQLWLTEPPGRFEAFPSLPAAGELHSLAGLADGPMALMTSPTPGGQTLSLRLLLGSRWISVEPPVDASPPRDGIRWSAFASGSGCTLIARRGATIELWRCTLLVPRAEPLPPSDTPNAVSTINNAPLTSIAPVWSHREIISVPAAFKADSASDGPMLWHADELVCAHQSEGVLRFAAWAKERGWRDVAQIDGVAERAAVLPLHDCGRVLTLWTTPHKGVTSGVSGRVPLDRSIHEISLSTGRLMYGGALKLAGPVSTSDYRFVMLSLLMVSATVLLFVLRPDEAVAFQLPPGFALAETPRRILATIVDFAVVYFAVWQVMGHSASDLGSSLAWRSHGSSVFFTALAASCLLNTLLEGLTGRTLGKRLMGCRVVRGYTLAQGSPLPPDAADSPNPPPNPQRDPERDPPPPPPGLGPAMIRNAVKWGLPPLAFMGLIDPEGRGRGDQLARTGVAVEIPDETAAE